MSAEKYEQLWSQAFLDFLNLPNADQIYQEFVDNECEPCLILLDGDMARTFPIKLFN